MSKLIIDTLPATLKPLVREYVRNDLPETKTELRKSVTPLRGTLTIPAAMQAVIDAYEQLSLIRPSLHCVRVQNRVMRKHPGVLLPKNGPYVLHSLQQTRSYALLPEGTPFERLARKRHIAVYTALHKIVDRHAHGLWNVTTTQNPNAVGVTQTSYVAARYNSNPVWGTDTHITIPRNWITNVQKRNMSVCDGMVTLDLAPLEAVGCELYAATWVRRTLGKQLLTERGYIARIGNTTFHGFDIEKTLKGINKKVKQAAFAARLNAADLDELITRCPDARVTANDARAIGACDAGIAAWMAQVGFAEREAVTLSEMYQAYQREPRAEARATILRVLRRNRATIKHKITS